MAYKKLIPLLNAENEIGENIIRLATEYSDKGADWLLLYNFSKDRKLQRGVLKLSKKIARIIDIPFCNRMPSGDF